MGAGAKFKVDGLRELDAALGQLSKTTARNVLKRAAEKAAEPLRAEMSAAAPLGATGELSRSIAVDTKTRFATEPGRVAYAQAMRTGASREVALQALRAARRANKSSNLVAHVFVGSTLWYAHFVEFGTSRQAARPFARPAFDRKANAVLFSVRDDLKAELDKAVARAARKAARAATKAGGG